MKRHSGSCAAAYVRWSLLPDAAPASHARTITQLFTIVSEVLRALAASAQVMDLLGPSLWDVWNAQGQVMSQEMVACIAVESVAILERLHAKGCVRSEAAGEHNIFRLLPECTGQLWAKCGLYVQAQPAWQTVWREAGSGPRAAWLRERACLRGCH